MGSRARAHEGNEPLSGDAVPGEAAPREAVPGADDFWGEGAAAVHGAIQPPAHRVDAPAAPPTRVRLRPPPRRPWGFSVRPPARGTDRPGIPWRVAIAAVVAACLVVVGAIGLAEGGGRRSAGDGRLPARGATADVRLSGSGEARQLGPTAGGRPIAGLLHSAQVTRAEEKQQEEARRRAAARRHHRLVLARAAARERRRRRETRRHRAVTASGTSSAASTATTPTVTPAPSTAPTTTAPSATSAGSSVSSGTSTTSTHHSAFGATGLLGAGHSSGDS
jgi:hypothetical protein